MSEIIRVELDCVTGERLIIRRAIEPDALVEVTIIGHRVKETVQIHPDTFILALIAFCERQTQ